MTAKERDKFTVAAEQPPGPLGPSPNYNERTTEDFRVSGMSVRLLVFVAAALAAAPFLAPAQTFPSRPVKIVVPTSPGGATDAFSRALAPRFSEIWGQPVLVENRPGANQIVGAEYVSRSAPDGATLLVSDASSFVINPHLYKNLPYNGLKGFTPITVLVRFPWVIAVHASVPANTFQEFVALARAKPGSLSYGSFGLGSSAHISVDYLKNLLGIDIVHVPYKGAGPAVTDLLAGQIQMMMVTPLLVESHARAGRLKLLAAATARRIAALSYLPTVAESGVPGYEAGTWFALVGPAGLPRETVARIYDDTAKILLDRAFREQYVTKQWFEVVGNTPEEFAEYIKSEYARWDRLIKLSRVTVE
jgi:tripartite-type tricarboxylate transporter receptor subunit TctC